MFWYTTDAVVTPRVLPRLRMKTKQVSALPDNGNQDRGRGGFPPLLTYSRADHSLVLMVDSRDARNLRRC